MIPVHMYELVRINTTLVLQRFDFGYLSMIAVLPRNEIKGQQITQISNRYRQQIIHL